MTLPEPRGKYRVACIGASSMGSWFDDIQLERAQKDGELSLEWVPGSIGSVCAATERLELVATCDLKAELVERMQRRWDIPAGYTDFRGMVERERPDIVAEVAESGLVRGIYCEKPVATSMVKADRIVAACARHRVAYTCAHTSAGTRVTVRLRLGSGRAPSARSAPSRALPWDPVGHRPRQVRRLSAAGRTRSPQTNRKP